METVTFSFQIVNVVAFGLTFVLAVLGMAYRSSHRFARSLRLFLLPLLLWGGLGLVYYAMLLTGRFTMAEVLMWGAAHRMYAGILALIAAVAIVYVLLRGPHRE